MPHHENIMVKETDLALEEYEQKPRTILLNAECDGVQRQKEILIQYSSGYIFVQTSQPIYVPRARGKGFSSKVVTRKNPKISDARKFAVITLKVKQDGVSLEKCIQNMQRELQTV